MVTGGANITHKCRGADTSQIGKYDIYNNRGGQYFKTPSDGKHGKSTSLNSGRLTQTTGLERLREDLHAKGILKRVTELITNSCRQSSITYFKSVGAKWSSQSIGRKISPIRSTLSCILDFLPEGFGGGLKFNTVVSNRSEKIEKKDQQYQHSVTEGRGASSDFWPNGCYSSPTTTINLNTLLSGDVETVLDYFQNRPNNTSLSEELLILQLAMVLALASPSSASDITNLDLENFSKYPNVHVFSVYKLTKTWRKGKGSPSSLEFYSFPSQSPFVLVEQSTPNLSYGIYWR